MAKYKVGDRVRIVNHRTFHMNDAGGMDKWFGKTMTIDKLEDNGYRMLEDRNEYFGNGWYWDDDMISGLAVSQAERYGDNNLSVVIHFSGNKTTARLMRGETVVKTASARRNPADNYSHAKGAALALERLFEKKKSEAEKAEAAKAHCRRAAAYKSALPKNLGDKFVVKVDCYRKISPGTIVTLITSYDDCGVNRYAWESGGKRLEQLILDCDLEPYHG
nr:MAG TPA: hypothetical protein [Caudoviricetes sp.]